MKELSASLGEIVNTVGLRGDIKLLPGPDFWWEALDSGVVDVVSDNVRRRITVDHFRARGSTVVIKLAEVSTIDEAEALVGSTLEVPIDEVADEFLPDFLLPCQTMGLRVKLPDGSVLGEVVDLLLGPEQNVLVVEGNDEKYLIPDVSEIVVSVDLEGESMEIDPPRGLLDLRW
ncbi:MAG: 16S rRNA processing protein RimM [Candidatus Latescibacteria bacterium 4484_7]|nr:MAG: 16S rRNA processing protein RimM [Candidatus Latescibacteria bacterium 4484_7]